MVQKTIHTDICVIGGGSAGLSVAAGAVQMGAKVVLIENNKMGGDCLNYGCVPSKSLITVAQKAYNVSTIEKYGLHASLERVDYKKVKAYIQQVIKQIEPHDSVERFKKLGVTVIQSNAHFHGPQEVQAGNTLIKAKFIAIATGSRPIAPPIPGLDKTPYLTNETVFDLDEQPRRLLIIGGGPIGCEMAQAHAMLGTPVTLLSNSPILPKDDPDLVKVVHKSLKNCDVNLIENIEIEKVEGKKGSITVTYNTKGKQHHLEGSHLLVAAGRQANVHGLELEKAKIEYTDKGIKINKRLQTTNKRVYALGDVAGGYQFTHVAGYHAGLFIKNTLFRIPAKADHHAVPWCTYTYPEMAHVGLNETQAQESYGNNIKILKWSFQENDRAQAMKETEGLIKVITKKNGTVLGCSIVAPHAGEIIHPWIIAVQNKQKLGPIVNTIAPYPTLSEASKRIAGSFYTDTLFSERTKKIVRFLLRFA
jgi:pyruvate/2-oxoglutarate dehydrogenase complex dihydrolipoamide dehydrogenase (E3) component